MPNVLIPLREDHSDCMMNLMFILLYSLLCREKFCPDSFQHNYSLQLPFNVLYLKLSVIILIHAHDQSCPTLCDPVDYTVHGILQAKVLEWVAFPFSRGSSQPRNQTQVSRIAGGFFYQLSHKGSPRILEWVAQPFSKGSSQPRNRTEVSCTAGRFFTN